VNLEDMLVIAGLLANQAFDPWIEYQPTLKEKEALFKFNYYTDLGENERLYIVNLAIQAGVELSLLPLIRELGEEVRESIE
jgi:hypothetical protein